MNVIIIIFLIIVFPLGYQFINKFFDMIDPIESYSEERRAGSMENNSKKALILGNDTDEFVRLLNKQAISCTVITDSNLLDPSNFYDYLIAVSHSDLDNLITCSIGSKRMGIKKIIALCNFSYNRKIYEDNHIPYLYGENIEATRFVTTLLSASLNIGDDLNVHH